MRKRAREYERFCEAMRVRRLSEVKTPPELLDKLRGELGTSHVPENLPVRYFDKYRVVVRGSQNAPLWNGLRVVHPKAFDLLVLRYGIAGTRFFGLREAGEIFGFTKQRAAELESIALRFLEGMAARK